MDSINNVCRVCLSTDNLKWVFDRKLYCVQKMNLKNMILTITGVEILAEDHISQKICTKCYRSSIKMYQFRMRARKNDKILKERYRGMLKTSPIEHEIPINDVTIKEKVGSEMNVKEVIGSNYRIHSSVRDVLRNFPRSKLPSPWMTSNIEPCIILKKEEIENFLKEKLKNKQISINLSKPDQIITKESTSVGSIVTDPLHTSSLSIMNTETDSVDDSFKKKIVEENSIDSEIESDNSNNGNSDHELGVIDNITVEPEMRGHTDNEFSLDTNIKDSSSSGPLPKEKPMGKSAERLCLDKSIPLLVCSICNSVHDNVKKLERHQLRHLRCQFCRSMFKSIRSMETHIKSSCAIKNMIQPSVELERIELNQRIKTKYPEAFIDYTSIPRLQLMPRLDNDTSEHHATGNDSKAVGSDLRYDDSVIEILSDDDTTSPPKNDISNNIPLRVKEILPVRNITQSKINSFFPPKRSMTTKKVSSTVPSDKSTSSSVISTTFSGSSTASAVVSAISPVISRHLISAYMVEPDITIKNSTVIDRIIPGLSDIESVKKLLTDRTVFQKQGFSQTGLSCSTSICIDERCGTIKLKNLRNLLVLYRIPVLLKNGDLHARYDYNPTNSKSQQPSKLCLWNDLFPVDIQVVSNASKSEDSVHDKIPLITSEVATKSDSTGMCTETTIDPFNSSLPAVTNLRTYSRKSRFSTLVNTSSGSSIVDVHHEVERSNSAVVSENLKHLLVRTNTAKQQSNTDTANSSTASYVQMYPKSTNKLILAKNPISVQPERNIADLQTTPVTYFDDMRYSPNVNPCVIGDLAVLRTIPLVSHISRSNFSDTRSNTHNSSAVQNEVPGPGPNLVPIMTASCSENAGSAFGSIRVKSLRDLT